jgi:hypothetical protein
MSNSIQLTAQPDLSFESTIMDSIGTSRTQIANPYLERMVNAVYQKLLRELGQLPFSDLDLLRQTYLHASRFSRNETSTDTLVDEIHRRGEVILKRRSGVPKSLTSKITSEIRLRDLRIGLVDDSLAELIHESHHYLGSPRREGLNLGLFFNGFDNRERLLMLATFSPFDLFHISNLLPAAVKSSQIVVLSRLFAFDVCPPNTISFGLARMFKIIQSKLSGVKMVMSYLNPNIGFSGAVYRASNWKLFGLERKERYLYLDGEYVTDRRLIDTYGSAKYDFLSRTLGGRIQRSVQGILPLHIYAYYFDERLKRHCENTPVYEFGPNRKLV